jgi:hypothetical protein
MGEHKRFILKFCLFLLPFALYLGAVSGILVFGGEVAPVETIATLQATQSPTLYGRAYKDNYFAYKSIAARIRGPKVLVLGSSRVMQFRAMFFHKMSASFYNAGGAAQSIYEADLFLDRIDNAHLPEVLIIGLDETWLNLNVLPANRLSRIDNQLEEENQPVLTRILSLHETVFRDLLQGKIDIGHLLTRKDPDRRVDAWGLAAILRGAGFRNDGSYQYDQATLRVDPAGRMSEGYQRIRDNLYPYERMPERAADNPIFQANAAALRAFLQKCNSRNVTVIGFAPPFAPGIHNAMIKERGYDYLLTYPSAIKQIFEGYGFRYFDFTDAGFLEATDEDMIDSFHGSEWVYLQLYMGMLNALPDLLGSYSDSSTLQQIAQDRSRNRFDLFGKTP